MVFFITVLLFQSTVTCFIVQSILQGQITYQAILLTVVDISQFYITGVISQQFSRRDLKPMASLVSF